MGLKFNVDKYPINNAGTRIKAAEVDRRASQYTGGVVRKKVNNNINKKLTLVNRKFLSLIANKSTP
jgi:hypothetical protein